MINKQGQPKASLANKRSTQAQQSVVARLWLSILNKLTVST